MYSDNPTPSQERRVFVWVRLPIRRPTNSPRERISCPRETRLLCPREPVRDSFHAFSALVRHIHLSYSLHFSWPSPAYSLATHRSQMAASLPLLCCSRSAT